VNEVGEFNLYLQRRVRLRWIFLVGFFHGLDSGFVFFRIWVVVGAVECGVEGVGAVWISVSFGTAMAGRG